MSVTKAWSTEDGTAIAYLVEDAGQRSLLVNDQGQSRSIHGEGIDLERKTEQLFEEFESALRPLFSVEIYPVGKQLTVASSHGGGRVLQVTAQGLLVNTGLNPNGIEQLLIATHVLNYIKGRLASTSPLDEQFPMLFRNNATLVGFNQGWKATAEIQEPEQV